MAQLDAAAIKVNGIDIVNGSEPHMWTYVENFAEAVGASTNDQPMHSLYVDRPSCESKAALKEALNMLFNLPVAEDGMKSLELW